MSPHGPRQKTSGRALFPSPRLARPLRSRADGRKRDRMDVRYYQANAVEGRFSGLGGRPAHSADARDRHRQDVDRFPDRLEAVRERNGTSRASRRAGRASCSSPTATISPIRPLTISARSPLSRRTRSSASSPDEISKRRRVPKNGSVFFTIFQTFMSGRDANGEPAPNFGEYPTTFSTPSSSTSAIAAARATRAHWRGILEYFAPALQIGLTATPKRRNQRRHLRLFRRAGLCLFAEAGHQRRLLTPFKIRQIATTLDDYVYTSDDEVLEGEVQQGRRYTETDFNRVIEIRERERHRVKLFMDMINQGEKTLVFCASQYHALAVRDLINQIKTNKDPLYCVRVTADDGKLGDQYLLKFRDNDKAIPTILTSSQKLSTGVDARNVRNIVLMRPIKSMIEFKQIIGRGTRLYDGKDYFTIYDFVKAYLHFNDPEWDGDPIGPEAPPEPRPRPEGAEGPESPPYDGDDDEDAPRPGKIRIKLADGKERVIQHMTATTFWSADGRPMSAAQFIESLFGELPRLFKDEDELRRLWSDPATRKALLHGLSEKGFGGPNSRRSAARSARRKATFSTFWPMSRSPARRSHGANARMRARVRSPRIRRQAADFSRFRALAICRPRRGGTGAGETRRAGRPQIRFRARSRSCLGQRGRDTGFVRRVSEVFVPDVSTLGSRGKCGECYITARVASLSVRRRPIFTSGTGAFCPGMWIVARRMAREARDE